MFQGINEGKFLKILCPLSTTALKRYNVSNGQEFILKPRPKKPAILLGGMSAAAFDRAVDLGVRLVSNWRPVQ